MPKLNSTRVRGNGVKEIEEDWLIKLYYDEDRDLALMIKFIRPKSTSRKNVQHAVNPLSWNLDAKLLSVFNYHMTVILPDSREAIGLDQA